MVGEVMNHVFVALGGLCFHDCRVGYFELETALVLWEEDFN